MLINAHPNLMACNHKKHTPLHLAARNGHKSVVEVLLDAGMDVNCQTEKGSALHEAALFGKIDVVRILLEAGINITIKDEQGRTVLDILKEHPSQKSQQIAALIQEFFEEKADDKCTEDPVRQCPMPTPRTSVSSPSGSPSHKTKSDAVTGELSKLLSEIKMCQEKDYSFEELCHTISAHSMDSFSSPKLSDEESGRRGSVSKANKRPSPPINPAKDEEEEEDEEKSCGPVGLWEALTPCNGCRSLGFPILTQELDAKCNSPTVETVPSPSLDAFHPEVEDSSYEFVATAVTRKPCSLEILRMSSSFSDDAPHVTVTAPEGGNHGNNSTGPTPDCSPPSPDTALKHIEKVIRPQPKLRTSLITALENHRLTYCHNYEIRSHATFVTFGCSPPISPSDYMVEVAEDCDETGDRMLCKSMEADTTSGISRTADETLYQQEAAAEEIPDEHVPEQFAGLLHGSSPACESPETPYQLYNNVRKHKESEKGATLPSSKSAQNSERDGTLDQINGDSPSPQVKPNKPQVVYRTIFHTRVNQPDGVTSVSNRPVQNIETRASNTGAFEDRACTLGRVKSVPKTLLEMHLSKTISKSDSNLINCSPVEEETRVKCCDPSLIKQHAIRSPERTPSFTAEWDEIDKIMSSIGAGIYTGIEELKRNISGPRCPFQSVGQWLESIGLPQYENHLLANGFDNVQFMGLNVVEDQDLLEIGILNSAHRQRILQAVRLLPKVRPIGYDGNNPTSVAEWLDSLELGDYTKAFLINGYTSMELVKKIWDFELINLLKINLLGHRKRILASLGDRLHEEPPQKPPRSITLRTTDWEPSISLRPPNEATSSTPVQYWQHHPEKLIFQSCDYEAYYLGSMLVKELRGTESTQDACSKMRKSTEQMKKVPTIILSVSYKGVKFIDAANKNIIAEHEIRNISCAAQDPEDLSTFAYITKDLKSSHHYCHVFTAFDVNLAYEIILTLGQAFEVAYQLALQARKGHSSTLPESFDGKPTKPIPKPRISMRKSVQIDPLVIEQKTHANVPWIVEPGQEAKRGINTNCEKVFTCSNNIAPSEYKTYEHFIYTLV
ncbi:ankyrin repeat and sterile alpha motif domain-containing protein 1B isoform X6 [Protopterus annectens]|uniref:ankyrin repeat and sterile alpha motif domain-containing protein 1B isoform X6 n=1 Tax=Protopterus annectens TaxID=7888 RepID=UPI001CFB6089|nr:ankyrin repeat and sterile alpha motif domain-containing protein 1B isoform X6 [Protopterus annectens]